ncbi:MAG: biotin--[acetyl-CoA-carboxylase] ligase [Spirochaetaceae bacterium]|nr:biotin--[acetyl-CoA-carboxylase] ligase [Spirochaetaceae bacterium]
MTTKDKVLEKLASAGGKPVSGEILASECDVSRAAIWKAVSALRDKGFSIEGTPNGGYVLADGGDFCTPELFHKTFACEFPEYAENFTEWLAETDSTMTYAKRLLSECGNLRAADGTLTQAGKKYHGAVIVAESQTAGRGRLGRTFVSPDKTGIYLSVIYAPSGGITQPAPITAFAAVAVCRAINKLYGINPSIKWINDIFVENGGKRKKAVGILTEGVTNFETQRIESAIIGIGLNIKPSKEFSGELDDIVGFIESAANCNASGANAKVSSAVTRCRLAAEVAGQLLRIYNEPPEKVMDEYKRLVFLIGEEVEVHPIIGDEKSVYTATAIDIDENASLVVRLKDGTTRKLSSGEVSLKSANFTK